MSTMELRIKHGPRKSTEGDSNKAASSLPTINILDDDCLIKIFSYLPIKDHMRIERVCKRWQAVNLQSWSDIKELEVYPRNIYNEKFHYKTTMDIFASDFGKVISRCGRFLKKLKCDSDHYPYSVDDIIPIIVDHCRNLQYLTLHSNYYSNGSELTSLMLNLHKLERLELFNLNERRLDECLKNIQSDSMKELYLNSTHSESDHLYGNITRVTQTGAMSIQAIKNLWKLELYGLLFTADELQTICLNKSITYLSFLNCCLEECINLIANFRGLKYLVFLNSWELNDNFLMNLAENCTELEELNIEGCTAVTNTGISALISLEKLTSLKIDRVCEVSDSVLSEFITLKILHCQKCRLVGDDGIIRLIQNAPYLEEINLYATSVSSKTLDAAWDLVDTRTNEIRLKVIISHTAFAGLKKHSGSCKKPSLFTISLQEDYIEKPDPVWSPDGYDDDFDDDDFYFSHANNSSDDSSYY